VAGARGERGHAAADAQGCEPMREGPGEGPGEGPQEGDQRARGGEGMRVKTNWRSTHGSRVMPTHCHCRRQPPLARGESGARNGGER